MPKNTSDRLDLNVAIFAYMPDASTAIEKLESAFEHQYPSIDLDLELWNPYDDSFKDDGLEQIINFDIVEVDLCRIDELVDGKFGGLDRMPTALRKQPSDFVGAAKSVYETELSNYVVPHWVCGLYTMFWAENTDVTKAVTFEDFCAVVGQQNSRPLHMAMWGSSDLGQLYGDVLLDIKGVDFTRKHLIDLHSGEVEIDETAQNAVLKLSTLLTQENRKNLEHFYNLSHYFPRQFVHDKQSVLVGYSERLYYAEDELQLTPGNFPPILNPEDLEIRQLSFGEISTGTPSWVDAFVIPQGKLAHKAEAISAFLQFIQSNEAYEAFAEPAPYRASSYLLPAVADAYDPNSTIVKKQPLLPKFLEAMKEAMPIDNSNVWQGMRSAGKKLEELLNPES
jgi:hypothetical protein